MVVIDVFIDERRVPEGESGLQTGNIIEDDAKDRQPIDQAEVRKTTECEELMDAGAEAATVECVIEVRRNVKPGITAKQGARVARYIGQGQTADCQDRSCARSNG